MPHFEEKTEGNVNWKKKLKKGPGGNGSELGTEKDKTEGLK